MIINNKKGFALVETLIVSTFVMAIFMVMYTNFYPMMGEYEKRENFDDIDSTFKSYFIRELIQNDTKKNDILSFTGNYKEYNKNNFCNTFSRTNYCNDLKNEYGLTTVVITNFNKGNSINYSGSDEDMKDYISNLSDDLYNPNNCKKRIIVKYTVSIREESNPRTVYRFSTIGVDC